MMQIDQICCACARFVVIRKPSGKNKYPDMYAYAHAMIGEHARWSRFRLHLAKTPRHTHISHGAEHRRRHRLCRSEKRNLFPLLCIFFFPPGMNCPACFPACQIAARTIVRTAAISGRLPSVVSWKTLPQRLKRKLSDFTLSPGSLN